MRADWTMDATERYVILCEGNPASLRRTSVIVTYLWGRMIRRHPADAFRYTVLDYEIPYIVDTGDLETFLERLPE